MRTGGTMREDERQKQAVLDRQQREGYTYEWLHTQVQHVPESPTPSNRRSDGHVYEELRSMAHDPSSPPKFLVPETGHQKLVSKLRPPDTRNCI